MADVGFLPDNIRQRLARKGNMAAITINVTEQQLQKLHSLAQKLGISTEELLSASLEDLLNSPKNEFNQAASYILQKNAELYHRLA